MIRVECTPCSDRGVVEPSLIWFGTRSVKVLDVIDRWYGSEQRWWKVATAEGCYIVRLDERTDAWELAAVVGEQPRSG